MTKEIYQQLENYMQDCMKDSAHDRQHVYRVLGRAAEIGKAYREVDWDVLIAACLLHDIGREAQAKDPTKNHAKAGAKMAYDFLRTLGWPEEKAKQVKRCIKAHRFRSKCPPETLEAKILFDCDKLEAAGAIGIARTLIYQGQEGTPLYTVDDQGCICSGEGLEEPPSFFEEYQHKLRTIYDHFYTPEAAAIAAKKEGAAQQFFLALREETKKSIDAFHALWSKINGIDEEIRVSYNEDNQ